MVYRRCSHQSSSFCRFLRLLWIVMFAACCRLKKRIRIFPTHPMCSTSDPSAGFSDGLRSWHPTNRFQRGHSPPGAAVSQPVQMERFTLQLLWICCGSEWAFHHTSGLYQEMEMDNQPRGYRKVPGRLTFLRRSNFEFMLFLFSEQFEYERPFCTKHDVGHRDEDEDSNTSMGLS